MNEQLRWLVRLQQLDTQADSIRQKREWLPRAIEEARGPIARATADFEKAKADNETLSRNRRDKERDLAGKEEKIAKLLHRTTEIKTNKEYQAHLAEIESAKQEKGNLEEALLVLMDQADQAGKEEESKAQVVNQEQQQFDRERQRMEAEMVEAEQELKKLEQEVKSAASMIPEKLLKEYDQLRQSRKGLAVVEVRQSTCQGCRLSIPPQLFAEVRKNEKILTCSHCHRFLYWPAPS